MECPRCKSTEFREVDCGPDGYDDDIFYTSEVCQQCGLWLDGWTEKWYVGIEFWQEVEDAGVYDGHLV